MGDMSAVLSFADRFARRSHRNYPGFDFARSFPKYSLIYKLKW